MFRHPPKTVGCCSCGQSAAWSVRTKPTRGFYHSEWSPWMWISIFWRTNLFCGELDGEPSVLRVVGHLGDGKGHARLTAAAANVSLPLLLLGPYSIVLFEKFQFNVLVLKPKNLIKKPTSSRNLSIELAPWWCFAWALCEMTAWGSSPAALARSMCPYTLKVITIIDRLDLYSFYPRCL